MFYYENLDKLVLKKEIDYNGTTIEADEIIIVSGYISAYPISELTTLGFKKITVFGGMYKSGINEDEYNKLVKTNDACQELSIYITNREVHSKLYVWKNNGKTISALIGSANLTNKGLKTDSRECMSELSPKIYCHLDSYLNIITKDKIGIREKDKITVSKAIHFNSDKEVNSDSLNIANHITYPSVELFLYNKENRKVESSSGLNWGFGTGNVNINDSCIKIPTDLIKKHYDFFIPHIFKDTSENRRVTIIWDDKFVMPVLFEGSMKKLINGNKFPKQISSTKDKDIQIDPEYQDVTVKSIMGIYLRKRMGIELSKPITYEMLEEYGRTSIQLTRINEKLYLANFSVQEKGEG
ncbi:restriction endonuclease PLD domain-containing protein [Psychrobacter nivimaris]|uniref:restriction endonuclease PLD domain-containing protein n=1 Tax=Psychrobacter nivimaris TaxID=281738 RepID=UPI003735C234